MKIKNLVSAIGVALYSAAAANAAVASTMSDKDVLKPLNFTQEGLKAFQKEVVSSRSMMKNDGLNVQLPSKSKQFVEEGLTGENVYIVRLYGSPVTVAARDTNSQVAMALKSAGATKLFSKGEPVVDAINTYQKALLTQQEEVIQEVSSAIGKSEVRRQFTKAINGFSIKMSESQAKKVSQLDRVSSVMRSKNYELLSDEGPKTIKADEIWDGSAVESGVNNKGEGQIIGIIDTGINSDHPSFADVGGDGYDHTNPWGAGAYVGDCVEDSEDIQCNDKLIGVRSYDVITESYDAMVAGWPAIGEDYQGHGSHVASTAGGNVLYDVPYMVASYGDDTDGRVIKEALFPEISGVAPHANIVAYQVCYPTNDSGYSGCPGEALVAGIEDAIEDGVDVINFSIGGADSDVWSDAVQLAFLSAREAGINVAAAAGNDGTGSCGSECFGYLDNSSPWLAQVAATTHAREIAVETSIEYAGFSDPELGSEVPAWSDTGLVGGAINNTEITGVVVWAKDYVDASGSKDSYGYCVDEYPENTFNYYKDGSEIAGAADGSTNVIVICQRHDPDDANANARTAKVANVVAGGADAFILYNKDTTQSTTSEAYEIPGVHFTYNQWNGVYPDEGLEDWVDSYSELGHMITIKPTVVERRINEDDADWLATFSSRGPSFSNDEILAPAMAAPGVNIYAAYSDEHPFTAAHGADYVSISGTSMASPHIAGAMALLRQTHPTWTPAEIQSALSMTADNVVQYRRLNSDTGDIGLAEIYRAGTGRINVANAAKSGLIMDETAENFMAANPYNGGTPHKLNMPNLVDFSCAPECQWVRTVKATKDGTWNVSHGDVLNWNYDMRQQYAQNGVNIEVTPSTFSLKAGETQSVVVTASIMDTQEWFSNSEVELHSHLLFESADETVPDASWPIVFKYDRGTLPDKLEVTAHENTGSYQVNGLMFPATEAPYGRVYQPVHAQVKTITLPKDDESDFPWTSSSEEYIYADRIDEATHTEMIEVPEGAKRLIVEIQGVVESDYTGTLDVGSPIVYVGKDYNGNGQPDPQEEILCVSNHIIYNNYCNVNNPEPGTYWAIIYNSKDAGLEGEEETFAYTSAVVTGDISTEMTVQAGPSDGENEVSMTLNWDMPMEEGDVYYTLVDLGSSEVNAGVYGTTPLKLERGSDRIHLDVTQEKANAGDSVPYTFEVLANNSGADRSFTITTELPEGMSVGVEDVLSSNNDLTSISLEGQTLTISGIQPDTSDIVANYIVTDSITDEMCRTPDLGNSNPGGYINLSEFGIYPALSGMDENGAVQSRYGNVIPVSTFFGGVTDEYALYNNADNNNVNFGILNIRGNGLVDLMNGPVFASWHYKMPYNSFPYESLAPLWRGTPIDNSSKDILSTGLSTVEGISLASTQSGWGIIEWDNAADYGDVTYDTDTKLFDYTKRDNSFDFEIILNAKTRFGENEHEIYFAYDNLDFGTTGDRGSIGIQGYRGALYIYGPLEQYLGQSIAYDNLADVITDDLVICMDYNGPESSQFEVTIWADIDQSSAGKSFEFTAVAAMDGQDDMTLSHTLSVASNITVGTIGDKTTMEDTAITVDVAYADELNTANQMTAMGENVAIVIEGDSLVITPDAGFVGDTEITVTVADIETPTDAASTSFMLTVENVNDAPTVIVKSDNISAAPGTSVTLDASGTFDEDGDTLSFEWTGPGTISSPYEAVTSVSDLALGEHVFTLTVSDNIETMEMDVTVNVSEDAVSVSPGESKSSGSMAWIMALLASLVMLRRKSIK
ncbi:S8 family serine peptidase [Pseudoalteromonas sp. MMG010]|uniref:S8 family serine peptidase n=1 Tax=Pseudoalteromonas sp. MMG010 TaxID=2822685 RepID=UPI001B3A1C02|nr:S8 family serine peptidase [Pseudoalteromonas sp. MMG010]MBQ4832147.1 S8 family serine peptidase [Pseudoalteromonas sp. MMG010]